MQNYLQLSDLSPAVDRLLVWRKIERVGVRCRIEGGNTEEYIQGAAIYLKGKVFIHYYEARKVK